MAAAGLGAAAGLTFRRPGGSQDVVAARRPRRRGIDVWATGVGGAVVGLVATGAAVYVIGMDRVVAINAADGRKLWTRPYFGPGETVAAANLLFVQYGGLGTLSANVDVLRAEDGVRVGRFHDTDQVQAEDGVVYVWGDGFGGSGQGIYVLRPGGGAGFRQIWSAPEDIVQQIVAGVVFTSGGSVLQGSDGTPVCTYPAEMDVQLVVDGVAYLGNQSASDSGGARAGVSALDLRDGMQLWTFPAASTVLAVSDGIAYLSDSLADDPAVYAIRARDGAQLWTFRTVSLGSPSLAAGRNIVYLGTGSSLAAMAEGGSGQVQALLAADGTELWRFRTLGDGPAALTLASDMIYVYDGGLNSMGAGDGGRITALRARDGAKVWGLQTGGSSPQLRQAGGVIYATVSGPFPAVAGAPAGTAVDNKVCALSPASGALMWSLTVPWDQPSSPLPMAVNQGIAYIADGGTIRALRSRWA
jgi:outer membrane protein assembly factor BamB